MPKTFTIDALRLERVQLLKDPQGSVQIFAEYALVAGGRTLQLLHRDVSSQLSNATRGAVANVLANVEAEVSAAELA
jgi:hypothetical protein